MSRATALVLLLGVFFSATSFSADISDQGQKTLPYYGNLFYGFVKSSDSESIKSELKHVLQGGHVKNASGPDTIVAACSGQANCYQHTTYGYNNARKFLLGKFYLTTEKGQYFVRDVYCTHEYSSTEFPAGQQPGPGIIPADKIVNIEHTWPQSKFSGMFPKEMQKSDMHHLFPTDSQMNSTRGNFEFGEVQVDKQILKCPDSRFGYVNSNSKDLIFEPPQIHKGNVARALFYFALKYDMNISAQQEAFLRQWDKEDPIDEEEKQRNEAIFEEQHSRNPFVDIPGLATKITRFTR